LTTKEQKLRKKILKYDTTGLKIYFLISKKQITCFKNIKSKLVKVEEKVTK